MRRPRIGISACLLGRPVRYNGGHKLEPLLRGRLGTVVDWLPVCPEVACGLPVPREPMHLVGDPADPRLVGLETGADRTERMKRWTERRAWKPAGGELCGFVFKSRSPSCGLRQVPVHGRGGETAGKGPGLFARSVLAAFPGLPVEDEEGLRDPLRRRRFLEAVFAAVGSDPPRTT